MDAPGSRPPGLEDRLVGVRGRWTPGFCTEGNRNGPEPGIEGWQDQLVMMVISSKNHIISQHVKMSSYVLTHRMTCPYV